MINRRRFLVISAAFAAMPGLAASWQGRALGGDVSMTLSGPREVTEPAIKTARSLIAEVEALFNLYDPASVLSQLNRTGILRNPPELFAELMRQTDAVHALTAGLFDPTIQTAWRALAEGRAPDAALIGWRKVDRNPEQITLTPGQELTFNGIAQGFATDLVTDHLAEQGFTNALVNIGEHRALGGPFAIGLSDPEFGFQGTRRLTNTAIATSSPSALALGNGGHILHPAGGRAKWSTVSVEDSSATKADGLSTALCLADLKLIERIRPNTGRITLIDANGDLKTI